jgi:hypothetical protein
VKKEMCPEIQIEDEKQKASFPKLYNSWHKSIFLGTANLLMLLITLDNPF